MQLFHLLLPISTVYSTHQQTNPTQSLIVKTTVSLVSKQVTFQSKILQKCSGFVPTKRLCDGVSGTCQVSPGFLQECRKRCGWFWSRGIRGGSGG